MLKGNGKNTVRKGEVIFSKGEELNQVGIVLVGKVMMHNDYIRMVRPQGSYLALNTMDEEYYQSTYQALEDSVVFIIPVEGEFTLRNIISKNADFRAIMISSQFKTAVEMYRIKTSLFDRAERLYGFAKRSYEEYMGLCKSFNVPAIELEDLDGLQPYEGLQDANEYRVSYYQEGAKIPLSANKMYFSYSEEMVSFQVNEITGLVDSMCEDCVAVTDYIRELMDAVCLKQGKNLFDFMCERAFEIKRRNELPLELHLLLTGIIDEIAFQYRELQKQGVELPEYDAEQLRKKMESLASKNFIADEKKSKEERDAELRRDVASLKGSMDQILKYAGVSEEDSQTIRANVEHLVNAADRLSIEDDVKKAKKAITPIFFKLYLSCFHKIKEGVIAPPKSVTLFMNYGFFDERLLDEEHLEFLCSIEQEPNKGPCRVYTMMEWLDLIYEGRREPSKSEFDEDYTEHLRSLKKQGEITEKEQKILLGDRYKRVEYEVMNMMTSNMRTVYGQPSSYMPILYKEAIFGYLDKILVTRRKINESVMSLLKVDYSVFYREVIYSNTQLKIINDTVMKNVYPDVILLPVYGINASMWQEVGSKSKGTPGRFCFPVMTSTNIDDLMVKMFGRFRWELCRCIQGMSWNDVKVKSLTSEYMDYIQFYRKNRDLSDDAREKVKLQIQKARNNSREIFLIDYEAWVKSEANGAIKMNKVARELLATYCPFEKTIRERLNAQRPYEIAQARSIRNAQKKKQELELKIKAIQKNTSEVPEEIMNTYKFYAEL